MMLSDLKPGMLVVCQVPNTPEDIDLIISINVTTMLTTSHKKYVIYTYVTLGTGDFSLKTFEHVDFSLDYVKVLNQCKSHSA